MLEGLHDRLEFLHDFVDCLVVFEVLGDHDSSNFAEEVCLSCCFSMDVNFGVGFGR